MDYIFLLLERARATLRDIGPAVWNGGFSTFLAVVLLAFSNSYVFKTFFKVSKSKNDNYLAQIRWFSWTLDVVNQIEWSCFLSKTFRLKLILFLEVWGNIVVSWQRLELKWMKKVEVKFEVVLPDCIVRKYPLQMKSSPSTGKVTRPRL